MLADNLKRLQDRLGGTMLALNDRKRGIAHEFGSDEFFSPANIDTNLLLEQKMHELLRLKRLEEVRTL